MLRILIASALSAALSVEAGVAQFTVGGPANQRPQARQGSPAHAPCLQIPPDVVKYQRDELEENKKKAEKGDAHAAYLVGKAYARGGAGEAVACPNVPAAISWYNMAVSGGDISATYRLGNLIEAGVVLVKGPDGQLHKDPSTGARMMRSAADAGFNPATDSVRRASSVGSSQLLDFAAAALAFGWLASQELPAKTNQGTSNNAADSMVACQAPWVDANGKTTWVPAFGSTCNDPRTRSY